MATSQAFIVGITARALRRNRLRNSAIIGDVVSANSTDPALRISTLPDRQTRRIAAVLDRNGDGCLSSDEWRDAKDRMALGGITMDPHSTQSFGWIDAAFTGIAPAVARLPHLKSVTALRVARRPAGGRVLDPAQREVMTRIAADTIGRGESLQSLRERLAALGVARAEQDAVSILQEHLDRASVTINFRPGQCIEGRSILDIWTKDPFYRNSYETNVSGSVMTVWGRNPGAMGSRYGYETALLQGGYRDMTVEQMPDSLQTIARRVARFNAREGAHAGLDLARARMFQWQVNPERLRLALDFLLGLAERPGFRGWMQIPPEEASSEEWTSFLYDLFDDSDWEDFRDLCVITGRKYSSPITETAYHEAIRRIRQRLALGEHAEREGIDELVEYLSHQRPRYGALNVARYARGAAPRYGDAYFVLREEVKNERTTFCPGDSMDRLAAPRAQTSRDLDEMLASDRVTDEWLGRIWEIASGESLEGAKGGRYLEAQIQGTIDLRRDIAEVVFPLRMAEDPERLAEVRRFVRALGVPAIGWHDGASVVLRETMPPHGWSAPD